MVQSLNGDCLRWVGTETFTLVAVSTSMGRVLEGNSLRTLVQQSTEENIRFHVVLGFRPKLR